MNTDNHNRNRLPQWQSEKMKSLLEERWSEVWEIVVARERLGQNSLEHSRGLQRNSR